ncbi:MAG TPA: GNAT family N-acetyltransferase [Parafilimonas sp.]|nr:GNAT family N-acetyltransferase [Parafilimonas sp.]
MITIRNATENDLQATLDIYNEIIANSTAIFQYELQTLEMRKTWFVEKKEKNYPVFVAEENNMIVGFSTFGQFRNWQAYKFSVENSVYVKADCRGRGIGKLLLQPLIDVAKEMQLHTIIAGIVAENEASLALHKQFGFIEVAHFKEVGYKFNKWLDLKFLQLMVQ